MNRKIIFIDMNPAIEQIPIYQLGICFLGGIAIDKKWDVDIIEFSDLQAMGLDFYKEKFDEARCIAISIRNIDNTEGSNPVSYIDIIKKEMEYLACRYSEKIVLGGAGYSILPNEILDLFNLKYGIVGRGGKSLSEMLDWLDSGNELETFFSKKIVQSRIDCDIYQYEKLEYIWKIIPLIQNDSKKLGFDTHIGCNGYCVYCTYPNITQNRNNKRSIDEICNFIAVAQEKGINQLQIVDDIFNSDIIYAKEICKEIAKISHNIKISCYLSPDVDEELAKLMRKAGIIEAVMGIDSLSNSILNKMNKNFDEKSIYQARIKLGKEKISVAYTFIVGSLYETDETLEETKTNIFKHMPDKITMQYGIRIYPNTKLYYEMNLKSKSNLKPYFAVSKTLSKEKCLQFMSEIKRFIDERKML